MWKLLVRSLLRHMIWTVTFRVSESALSSISFLSGRSSLACHGLPLFQVEGYAPAPNQKGLGWHKLAQTPISHLHLRTYVDDSPLQIPHKERGKETKTQNKQTNKKGQETVKFHCDHATAKYTFCSLQKMHEGQIKAGKKYVAWVTVQLHYSFSFYFPPLQLVQFRKRIEYNTVR